ncbi:MAG: hypothetical protein ABH846_00585, partial [Patescibacteria group bacterium]
MRLFGKKSGGEGSEVRPTTTESKEKKSTLRMPTRLEMIAAAGGAVALGAVGLGSARGEREAPQSPEVTQVVDKYVSYAEAGSYDADFRFPFARWNNQTGTVEVNPLRILEPAYVSLTKAGGEGTEVHFTVPQILMEANPTNEADYEEMNERIKTEIRDQLASHLIGFSWDKNDWASTEGSPDQPFTVESITVTGTASPEWGGGSQTIEPGHVEPENIELSEMRAEDATRRLREVLSDMGIDVSESLDEIEADEIQFSPDEMATLESLARILGEQGSTNDAIYLMITKYNLGKLENEEVVSMLDEIVASKRTIQVEIKLKEKKANTVLVPLPFLLLLGALPLLRRRKEEKNEQEQPKPVPSESDKSRQDRMTHKEQTTSTSEQNEQKTTSEINPPSDVREGVWEPRMINMPPPPELSEQDLKAIETAEHEDNLLDVRPDSLRAAFTDDVMSDIAHDFSYYEYVARWHASENEPDINDMTHEILALWEKTDNKEPGEYRS